MFIEKLRMKLSPFKKTRKRLRQKFKQEQELNNFQLISYSQEGEDLIANSLLDEQALGFYVDVGAHHPYRFSNTAFFYKKGWSGINIDPLPGVKAIFDQHRPRDVNLEIGISNLPQTLTYHMFKEPAYNGFCSVLAQERIEQGLESIGTKLVECATLGRVLNEHMPAGQNIDFLSIDAEGLDFAVLQSSDWEKYKPRLVIIEILGAESVETIIDSDIYAYLKARDYSLAAKSLRSVFFKLR